MPRKTGKRTSTADVLPVDSNDIVPAGPLAGGLDAADGALLADLAGQTAARWAKADAEATELKFGTVDVEPPEILDGPSVPEITHPAVEEPADQAKPAETVTRRVAVDKLLPVWPSIEADLNDASRNGLRADAGAPQGRGWHLERMRQWAARKGKLREPASILSLTRRVHRLR